MRFMLLSELIHCFLEVSRPLDPYNNSNNNNNNTDEELQVNLTREANWKSPQPNKLPNFWIKQFKSLHKSMAIAYSVIINDPQQIPEWLVEGVTNLLPKNNETWTTKNYRPIACLPTTFKILTSIITDRLYTTT